MNKIIIKKSETADTRSAKSLVSKEVLLKSSEQHIKDVQNAMKWMKSKLNNIAKIHDWTKLKYIDLFYSDFHLIQKNKQDDFKKLEWYNIHINKERHHVNDRCPKDVNLFDLLERIADITTAGMARTGEIYDDELDSIILQKAYENTVKLLKENIIIKEE